MTPLAGGGAIVAWLDTRLPVGQGVYAQRVTRWGRAVWTPNGAAVCTAPGSRGPLSIAGDGSDGVYVAWADSRPEGELYATRLTGKGTRARGWPGDGALVCQWQPTFYPEDRGGGASNMSAISGGRAIVAWQDVRQAPNGPDIDESFAMLLTRDGPAVSPPGAGIVSSPAEPAAAQPAIPSFALCGVHPNPAARGAVVRFALPDAAPATLALFDISGRRMWSRDLGALASGEHHVLLGDGAWFPPGLYLMRLTQGARTATARVVIVR